jgi:type IV pilus assembly protein PilV
MKPLPPSPARARGFAMIEVLVTLVILLFGLLGLAALQSRAQVAETESYQRTQALILLRDMADRINANRGNAASVPNGYTTLALVAPPPAPLGVAGATPALCAAPPDLATADVCQWDELLKGSAETIGAASTAPRVGAMVGARGCVEDVTPVTIPPSPTRLLVSVVWQGLGSGRTAAPPASVACGSGSYGFDDLRRAVTTVVEIGNLNGP